MPTNNDVRRAHDLLDDISIGHQPNEDDLNHLRSFLPELPKQKALAELTHDVYDAWIGADGNDWDDEAFGELETWLKELHTQLKGLAPAAPAHPEFLETEADYQNAPAGTVAAVVSRLAWEKEEDNDWTCGGGANDDYSMALSDRRRVLRWGWGE